MRRNSTNKQQESLQLNNKSELQIRLIRYAFRSYYSLFGYCLDYKWLNLLTIKTKINFQNKDEWNRKSVCHQCNETQSEIKYCVCINW